MSLLFFSFSVITILRLFRQNSGQSFVHYYIIWHFLLKTWIFKQKQISDTFFKSNSSVLLKNESAIIVKRKLYQTLIRVMLLRSIIIKLKHKFTTIVFLFQGVKVIEMNSRSRFYCHLAFVLLFSDH